MTKLAMAAVAAALALGLPASASVLTGTFTGAVQDSYRNTPSTPGFAQGTAIGGTLRFDTTSLPPDSCSAVAVYCGDDLAGLRPSFISATFTIAGQTFAISGAQGQLVQYTNTFPEAENVDLVLFNLYSQDFGSGTLTSSFLGLLAASSIVDFVPDLTPGEEFEFVPFDFGGNGQFRIERFDAYGRSLGSDYVAFSLATFSMHATEELPSPSIPALLILSLVCLLVMSSKRPNHALLSDAEKEACGYAGGAIPVPPTRQPDDAYCRIL